MFSLNQFSLTQIYDKPIYKIDSVATSLVDFPLKDAVDSLIIVPNALQESEQAILNKVLKALKYEEAKVKLIIQKEQALSFKFLNNNFPNIQRILVYGLLPKDLQLNTLHCPDKVIELSNIKMLFTVSLSQLGNYPYKKWVWEQTKELFVS